MRAAGGVMGQARDGFGTGVGVLLPVAPLGPAPPPSITPGEGQAADGQQDSAVEHHNSTAALDALDATGRAELDAAGASASGGRGNMESIIAAAVADVQALGLSTNTPEGKRALIAAIKTRLEETRGTVQTGAAEAGTHAASANANAAGYGDVAGLTRPAGMGANPLGAMPMSGGMPMGGGGMPGFGAPLSGLSGLTAPFTQAAKLTGSNGSPAAKLASAAIPGLDTSGPGKASERGLQQYTKLMNRAISNAFPEIEEIGGWRQDALKWHPDGLALDVMIPNWDTAEGRALGDRVVNFLIRNQKPLGLDHIIWRQQMIQPDGSSSRMDDQGNATQNHYDHVHVASLGGGY
ncbi:hypothetical protein [Mycolicibacterium gadium]|uniref:ARB-07466-like C-terminal domain-containing protein n=3 Tax=Mycolicibacterium TaxID=1866885 RepID=A0ABT6GZA3_MYCGU|nr:hypothetical protein [Mycolicibacterium gadium]MDG5486360.1 hypothetical protein [Mycolicibacterium gadium]